MVSSLDHLNKECWSVFQRFCENLEKISLLIVVDQDLVLLEHGDVFFDIQAYFLRSLPDHVVVGVRDFIEEFDSSGLHPLHRLNNVFSPKSDVLHSSSAVILHILLDLTLPHTISWLVDWHLDLLIKVCHHD